MEFWGVEVPSGKPLTCKPGPASYVHVSQAALGDNKNTKGNDRVVLKVKVGTNEVVVGTLSQGKCDQTTLDLIFEKDFVLSHNSSGSVFFCGYKTDAVRDDDSMSSEEEEEFDISDEDKDEKKEELLAKENGKLGMKAKTPLTNKPAAKPASAAKAEVSAPDVKPKGKLAVAEKAKDVKDDEDESEDEDEDEDGETDSSEDDEMMGSSSDEGLDSDEDLSEDEPSEEEQPKSVGKIGKKRPAAAMQAGTGGKKNKMDIPAKAEPKTPVLASTPKQQQQSGKKDVSAKKAAGKDNSATPIPGKKLGQFFCEPCKKNFNSETALSQHKMAKHK